MHTNMIGLTFARLNVKIHLGRTLKWIGICNNFVIINLQIICNLLTANSSLLKVTSYCYYEKKNQWPIKPNDSIATLFVLLFS